VDEEKSSLKSTVPDEAFVGDEPKAGRAQAKMKRDKTQNAKRNRGLGRMT